MKHAFVFACIGPLFSCADLFASMRKISIMMVGDSLMEHQYLALVKWKILDPRNVFHSRSACYNEPQTVEELLLAAQLHLGRPPELVYLNFQTLHHLHLHPIRPWVVTETCSCRANDQCTSGFWGYYLLEEWVTDVVHQYLHSPLLANATSSPVVVVMTPNAICEEKFYGLYKGWFDLAGEHYRQCASWLHSTFATRCAPGSVSRGCSWSSVGQPLWQSQLRVDALLASQNFSSRANDNMESLCRDGVFGRNGSLNIAIRMRRVLGASTLKNDSGAWSRVGLLDAFALTEAAGCDHTNDGRHYDLTVIDKQIDELARVYNLLRERASAGRS